MHPPFNIQKEKSRKISKSRSRNHSHEFTPVVAPSSTHSPSFVTCLEYVDGGVSMKILRYYVISPLVYNTLWVSVSEWVYIYTGVDDLLCRGLGGGGQTHSYGGPIFEIFFLPERYRKMRWRPRFLFSFFWFFKAVGPKMSFSVFFVARP